MTQHWTSNGVKAALIEAFTIDRLIGGRFGPKMYGSAMPSYIHDDDDLRRIEFQDRLSPEKGGTSGDHWRDMQNQRRVDIGRSRQFSPRQISQMEAVLFGTKDVPAWIHGILAEDWEKADYLEAYSIQSAMWKLRGGELKENRLCKRMGWSYQTYRSNRDEGAEIITFKLNSRGVGCWINVPGTPETDPRKVPLTVVLLEFLKGGPKSKAQFIAFCHNHRIIPARDMNNRAVAVAIAKLVSVGRIKKRYDLAYERV